MSPFGKLLSMQINEKYTIPFADMQFSDLFSYKFVLSELFLHFFHWYKALRFE